MAGRAPTARSAVRMASARFPGRRRPAARGMKRSLPYVLRQHSWSHSWGSRSHSETGLNGSDHHRYGEVKTRLTIGRTGHFAWYYDNILEYYFWRPMMATTVTSKGQVTIPKPVRDHLG